MKKHTLSLIAGTVFLLCNGLVASARDMVKVQVPFDFQVNGRELKAGEYIIERDSQEPRRLLIQSTEGKTLVIVNTMLRRLSKDPSRTSLLFQSYGEQHFLAEVRVAGNEYGYTLIKSKAERKLARMAEAEAKPGGATTNH
jgi:hypothetical protein